MINMKSNVITVKDILYEVFGDYKKPSMLIGVCSCDWKCCKESKNDVCQNMQIAKQASVIIKIDKVINKYISNQLTEAIVFGGLEPFLQFNEIYSFIDAFRNDYCRHDDIVIYTGYYKNEIAKYVKQLKKFDNIIIKYGRFIPNKQSRYDDILGVTLASDNQYAEKIS